jgi:N-acetylmuramic acid 6-phosphate etherase
VGIEGGGTRTSILAVRGKQTVADFQLGPCTVLMPEPQLLAHFLSIRELLPSVPDYLGIGLAAARHESHCEIIRRIAADVWPGVPVVATSDLETALAAGSAPAKAVARILILSGTGSCCFGRSNSGKTAKIGGRGHVMGDRASSVDIGRHALRRLAAEFDRHQHWGTLGRLMLHSLNMNHPEDLIPWSLEAGKREIAALALPVFAAAARGDRIAKRVLHDAAKTLAADAHACARLLAKSDQNVHFVLNGSVLVKNQSFARKVIAKLKIQHPNATAAPLARPSVWGAVVLAQNLVNENSIHPKNPPQKATPAFKKTEASLVPAWIQDLSALAKSPTELRNPRSSKLSEMSLPDAVHLMLDEDATLADAIRAETDTIVRVTQHIIRAFKNGGHLFYVGAGTSGRLGVLDASEIPPTFRTPPELVQGIIAGGQRALWSAVEGAEDDASAGADAARFRQVGKNDVVVGIAASGRTPFVWGFLTESARKGAHTALLCFNPAVKTLAGPPNSKRIPQEVIAPNIGPEILTGSTRLKSGTATKLILNLFTTLAMTKLGKVKGNLMIDLNPSNVKLRDRAIRIIRELTGLEPAAAKSLLEKSHWSVPAALKSANSSK